MNKNVAVIIGAIFTAFIVFALIHNTSNNRHSVEFFSGSNFSGYEQTPPAAQVDVSPAIAWKEHTPGGLKFLGWFFLAAMWAGLFYVSMDFHIKKTGGEKKENTGLAYLVIAGPLLLSIVFFFAAYSSGQSSNSVSVLRSRFDGWVQTGAIKQKGEKTYVDASGSDTLKNLFTNKIWIK
jgi:NADH:ubiquinone oxidoreductase subunit 5 (subunit L)/multisubunit Na+/H+ antiporter MnhA subunit